MKALEKSTQAKGESPDVGTSNSSNVSVCECQHHLDCSEVSGNHWHHAWSSTHWLADLETFLQGQRMGMRSDAIHRKLLFSFLKGFISSSPFWFCTAGPQSMFVLSTWNHRRVRRQPLCIEKCNVCKQFLSCLAVFICFGVNCHFGNAFALHHWVFVLSIFQMQSPSTSASSTISLEMPLFSSSFQDVTARWQITGSVALFVEWDSVSSFMDAYKNPLNLHGLDN